MILPGCRYIPFKKTHELKRKEMRRIELIKKSCGTSLLRKPSPVTPAVILLVVLITVCGCAGNNDPNSGIPADMMKIQGGPFRPVIDFDTFTVDIEPFYMDKYEVTIAQFEKFVNETGFIPQSDKPESKTYVLRDNRIQEVSGVNWRCDQYGVPRDTSEYNHPVIHVSHEDAVAYATWAGKRLPTIFEWQYAAYARANRLGILREVIFNSWNTWVARQIHPVGQKSPNRFGLYDMFGNVDEHVAVTDTELLKLPGMKPEDIVRASYSSFFNSPSQMYPIRFSIGHKMGTSLFKGFRCAKDI
jgi:formylglycine-generating enzyme